MTSSVQVAAHPNLLRRAWKQWFALHSTDRTERFRERTIRGMVPILACMVVAGILLVSLANESQALPVLAGMGVVVIAVAITMAADKLDLAAVLLFLFPV